MSRYKLLDDMNVPLWKAQIIDGTTPVFVHSPCCHTVKVPRVCRPYNSFPFFPSGQPMLLEELNNANSVAHLASTTYNSTESISLQSLRPKREGVGEIDKGGGERKAESGTRVDINFGIDPDCDNNLLHFV